MLNIERNILPPGRQPVSGTTTFLWWAIPRAITTVIHIMAKQARDLFGYPVQHALFFQLLLYALFQTICAVINPFDNRIQWMIDL